MRVVVRVYTALREKLGWSSKEVELAGGRATLAEVVNSVEVLRDLVGERLLQDFIVLVNGRNARLLNGLETELADGDVVDIFPPAAGGGTD